MTNRENEREAEGLWQLAETVAIADDRGKQINNAVTFRYADGTVTLRMLSPKPGLWRSEDDFYKLTANWEGDALYYRPPFGDFAELAIFEDGRFVNIGNGVKRIFERIAEDDVVDWNRDILNRRDLHDYGMGVSG
ncbi:MAG TPA: hypothetical protein VK614_10905 [Allosphingosinicella sp.]|nr:hypothetical protein [Allosphingosinicella sp.]